MSDGGLTAWAYPLAESLLADALPRRWAHVQGVAARARTLAPILGADAELLEAAAVLHDIGYAPDLVKSGLHPLDGARYLREVAHADERVVRLVAHHSCAWMEAEARGLVAELGEFAHGAPELDDALCYCDMNTTPDGTPTNPIDRINEITSRYGPESLIGTFIRRAEPEILASTARVLERVAAVKRQPM
ncbi:HD domain-containing protein [Streptomyces sp. NBC_00669]|uniref:HD domain-containing protein n=1 Tax=Streptomyces sp. NBC_00669 TaxID=2976011 RepID=UPI002E3634B4|nr:HD domain-containing protein [Streptomyces sp. NBC_00669]